MKVYEEMDKFGNSQYLGYGTNIKNCKYQMTKLLLLDKALSRLGVPSILSIGTKTRTVSTLHEILFITLTSTKNKDTKNLITNCSNNFVFSIKMYFSPMHKTRVCDIVHIKTLMIKLGSDYSYNRYND